MTPVPSQLALFERGELAEVATSSRWCQRWTDRAMSWQLAEPEKRFRPGAFEVKEIDDDTTPKAYILANHYSGSYPSALRRFGLYHGRVLVGVAVYSGPQNKLVLTNPFPDLVPFEESMELGRLVLDDWVPGNAESWFITQCQRRLYEDGVRGIVSFSDPVPRTTLDGDVIAVGHVGFIYQGCNAMYLGRGTKRSHWLMPDGTIYSPDALKKIRTHEKGWQYAEQGLVDCGARPRRGGEGASEWLAEVRLALGVRSLRHRGVHRYVFRLGKNRREREAIRIGKQFLIPDDAGDLVLPAIAYPKRRDEMRVAA